jgi:hypothetical protein
MPTFPNCPICFVPPILPTPRFDVSSSVSSNTGTSRLILGTRRIARLDFFLHQARFVCRDSIGRPQLKVNLRSQDWIRSWGHAPRRHAGYFRFRPRSPPGTPGSGAAAQLPKKLGARDPSRKQCAQLLECSYRRWDPSPFLGFPITSTAQTRIETPRPYRAARLLHPSRMASSRLP